MTESKPGFFRKYIWEGQHLDESTVAEADPNSPPFVKFFFTYRKYIALLIPFLTLQIVWWAFAIHYNWFELYATRWQIPLVMVLGSLIAGMTSEGGGAVAFPIMTLALHIAPDTARDFSLIIQSFGMSSAAFTVLFMRVQIEKRAVVFGTIGSIPGFLVGTFFISPYLENAEKKMLFVAIWSSFAIALYLLNTQKERDTFATIPQMKIWKYAVLIVTGFVGGIFTSFAGSGVDICIFSMLTLLFRITEKTATPTTIVLMCIASIVGVAVRAGWQQDVAPLAWDYVKVSIPVVVLLAPLGSFLGSHFHRKVLAWLVYILEFLSVIGFLLTRPSWILIGIGCLVMVVGYVFFRFVSWRGKLLIESIQTTERDSEAYLEKGEVNEIEDQLSEIVHM